jgi:hypothetical protein
MKPFYSCGVFLSILSYRFFPQEAKHISAAAQRMRTDLRGQLSNSFKIPAAFWTPAAQEASGFFGCQAQQDENDNQTYCAYDSPFGIKKKLTRQPHSSGSSSKKQSTEIPPMPMMSAKPASTIRGTNSASSRTGIHQAGLLCSVSIYLSS